jgi:hypothetical protein
MVNDLENYYDDRAKSHEKFNVDVGCTLRPFSGLSLGVYAKNLIPDSYRYPSGAEVDVHTQFRAGISYSYEDYVTVAMDVDLNRAHYDTVRNYRSRMVGGGLEFTPVSKKFPLGVLLRMGAMKNIEDEKQDGLATAGFSLKYWKISLDANGTISFGKVQIQTGADALEIQERASYTVGLTFLTTF